MKKRQVSRGMERPMKKPMSRKKFAVVSNVGGTFLVLCCAGLCVLGTTSAVNALNRNAAVQISRLQDTSPAVVPDTGTISDTSVSMGAENPSKSSDYDYTNDQLDWAHQYHITWDANGNPMDENGQIMNDPTTEVNEVARAISNGSANENGVSMDYLKSIGALEEAVEPSVTESAATNLYDGVANVSKTGDGSYLYTVQSGDNLNRISEAVGVSLSQLIDDNQLDNPSVLYVGQQLKLPSADVTVGASGAGLG